MSATKYGDCFEASAQERCYLGFLFFLLQLISFSPAKLFKLLSNATHFKCAVSHSTRFVLLLTNPGTANFHSPIKFLFLSSGRGYVSSLSVILLEMHHIYPTRLEFTFVFSLSSSMSKVLKFLNNVDEAGNSLLVIITNKD